MTSYSDVAERWVKRVTGETSLRQLDTRRVFARGDVIYSYGSHFEIARALRNRKGDVRLWLFNGERYSHSTTNHQGHVRWAINTFGQDIPVLTVPFPALDAAGIDIETVEAVQIKPDRWLPRLVNSPAPPAAAEFENGRLMLPEYMVDYTHHDSWTPHEREVARRVFREDDGTYSYVGYNHVLGESLIRARVGYTVRGERRSRWAHFLSSFDYQERWPLYFFCELPNQSARTVGEALEVLKPPTVKAAELVGRPVKRQGDIFAVEVALDKRALRKRGASFEKQGMLLGTNHVASEVAQLPDGTLLARGTLRHAPQWRDPDHKRVKMGSGKAWHIIVKNTVPVSR